MENLKPVVTKGKERVKALVTTCKDYTLENFEDTLYKLNLKMEVEEVEMTVESRRSCELEPLECKGKVVYLK